MLRKHTMIVGARFRGAEAVQYCKDLVPGDAEDLKLVPEPENAYDENAVAVYYHPHHHEPIQLGYIPKELAAKISPILQSGGTAKILEVEGGGTPFIFLEVAEAE